MGIQFNVLGVSYPEQKLDEKVLRSKDLSTSGKITQMTTSLKLPSKIELKPNQGSPLKNKVQSWVSEHPKLVAVMIGTVAILACCLLSTNTLTRINKDLTKSDVQPKTATQINLYAITSTDIDGYNKLPTNHICHVKKIATSPNGLSAPTEYTISIGKIDNYLAVLRHIYKDKGYSIKIILDCTLDAKQESTIHEIKRDQEGRSISTGEIEKKLRRQ